MNRKLTNMVPALVVLVLISLAIGCGSAGVGVAGDVSTPAPAPKVDVKSQVGDNGLLTPAAIFARYVEALGGENALRAHSSSTGKGKMEITAMGMSGDVVRYAAAPDKVVLNIELGGFGSMSQGFNGEVGWADNPMQGAMLLEGKMLTQMKQQADYFAPLRYTEIYTTQETAELTEHNGEGAFKVRLVDSDGTESFHYFSEATSLLIGMEGTQSGPQGDGPFSAAISEYQDFGGVKVATVTVLNAGGMEIKQTVTEVTYDDVADSSFVPPDAVKKLLD